MAVAQSTITASEVAAAVGGTLVGDGSTRLTGVAALDRAGGTDLSFLAHARYAAAFTASRAGAVLVTEALAATAGGPATRIVVDKPHDALVALLPRLYTPEPFVPGVHPTAIVAPGARVDASARVDAYAVIESGATVGARAWIGPHSVVGADASIGADSRLVAQVTLYPRTVIGERTVIHAGARLGSDGFGYAFREGAHRKIPHVGRCIVGNDVEIGANCTIDRGSVDDTVIGDGTKLDNLVHLAHNVRVGRLCLLMAQVGVAGSTRIEDGAILAGQVGVAGHHVIGKGATIGAQGGVFGDVPPGETWSGYPARPHREALRAQAAVFKLAEFMRRVERFLTKAGG